MITKRRVSLGGVQLDEIDERIIIQSIDLQAGKDNINTVALWGADGSRVTGQHRDYLDVGIKFGIRMKADEYTARSEVFEKVISWAMPGGMLRVNTKPGRRLRVICAQVPAEGDALGWNNDYSITFRAYGIPYWQEDTVKQTTISNQSSATASIEVAGNVPSALDFIFENKSSGAINTVKITAGDSVIALEGLGLLIGETLYFDHNDNGKRSVVRIRIRNVQGKYRSVLDKRSDKSDNDLTVNYGAVSVKLEAERKGTWTIESRGRYA